MGLAFWPVLQSLKRQNSVREFFFISSCSPIWPHKHLLISISGNLFVIGMAFRCASFVVFHWLEKVYLECTTIKNIIKSCYQHFNRRIDVIRGHWELRQRRLKCDQPPLTHGIDGNSVPPSDSALWGNFLAAKMWCLQFRMETWVEAERAARRGMHTAIIPISVVYWA